MRLEEQMVWGQIFRDKGRYWYLCALAKKRMGVESLFQRWRFDDVPAVDCVIGDQPGTGSSSGVSFLRRALDLRCFHDLFDVRPN